MESDSLKKPSVTSAIRALRVAGIAFEEHLYDYEEKGGTAHSAACLGVDEHAVLKTLVFEDENSRPILVLMHGDRQVSTQKLARHLGVKRVGPCTPETATKHTGYLVGGTSPFGTKKPLPVYVETSVQELSRVFVNGGRRGFLVSLSADDLVRLLIPTFVEAAV